MVVDVVLSVGIEMPEIVKDEAIMDKGPVQRIKKWLRRAWASVMINECPENEKIEVVCRNVIAVVKWKKEKMNWMPAPGLSVAGGTMYADIAVTLNWVVIIVKA